MTVIEVLGIRHHGPGSARSVSAAHCMNSIRTSSSSRAHPSSTRCCRWPAIRIWCRRWPGWSTRSTRPVGPRSTRWRCSRRSGWRCGGRYAAGSSRPVRRPAGARTRWRRRVGPVDIRRPRRDRPADRDRAEHRTAAAGAAYPSRTRSACSPARPATTTPSAGGRTPSSIAIRSSLRAVRHDPGGDGRSPRFGRFRRPRRGEPAPRGRHAPGPAGRDQGGPRAGRRRLRRLSCARSLHPDAFPPAAHDNRLLARLPKTKVAATWAPWTSGRLALDSGYGAGVTSPGWYQHLFATWRRAGGSPTRSYPVG